MKGWMKYRYKGDNSGFILRQSVSQLYFCVTDDCVLIGNKDENSIELIKPEVSFNICNAAITINQDNANQFELVGNGYHLVFTVESAQDALDWMSYLQLQRSIKQGVSPAPSRISRKSSNNAGGDSKGMRTHHASEVESVNGELVFDDPLSAATLNNNSDFEWDNQTSSSRSPHLSMGEETSAVFQLSKELSSAKTEIDKFRQRVQSYQEVLAQRDRQLFEVRDKLSSHSYSTVDVEDYKNLEMQVRSYKEQNALLNEEILKLHQMNNRSGAEASKEKRRADGLASELLKFQREYVTALGCCVYRPLVDPDDGAFFDVPFRGRHIATIKSLARSMKSTNDRILGCSIPVVGKTEHTDAFNFVHVLPNESLQVQYLCNHLQEAYNILSESKEDNEKKMAKWKKSILDNSNDFEVSPHLRKLVLQGVPSPYRACLWLKIIHYYVADLRNNSGESYYEVLLSQQENYQNNKDMVKYFKQITMDVPRTMPNNKDYTSPSEPAHRDKLQNVLRAFCIHNPNVGYCQGFNFLAGGCLLFLEEEDAFWFLVAVVEKIFPPDYYQNGLSGLLADQKVLQYIISLELPRLYEHLLKFPDVDLAAVTTGWFLGLFFDCLPFQTLIRVWDCFLSHGHEAVFRIAFAMFKIFEPRLLELNELSQLLHGTKNIPKICVHHEELIKEAFSCSFPAWEEVEEMRSQWEVKLVERHEKEMIERRYYDQRMLLLDEDQDVLRQSEDYSFNCGAAGEKVYLAASCRITRSSQLYQVEADLIRPLRLPVTDRVTCCYVITDDIILLGLFSGQLQAYSLNENLLRWSMSLSDVVLCIISYDVMISVGTADGKLHFLQIADVESEKVCTKKPALLDSIELSKKPTTCCCYIPDQSCLWVASGPAIYVVSVETNETDAFFLISSRIDFVSAMLHWSSYVLISVRGSSLLQLHSAEAKNTAPLLVYDIARQTVLPPSYPMMPDENAAKSPTSSRITSIALISEGVFWVGTAGGDVAIYMVESKSNSIENVQTEKPGASSDDPSSSVLLRMLRTQHIADRSIRCLIKTPTSVVSCGGYCGEEGAVRIWNFEGDFTVAETGVSESSSSDILEDSKSLASSSRSLDVEGRMAQHESSETWKSLKSGAAAMMKSSRPKLNRFMKMLGN